MSPSEAHESNVSALAVRWRSILGTAVLGGVAFAAGSFLIPVSYESSGSFTVEASNSTLALPSQLAMLASQFDLGSQLPGLSPWFFVDLAKSDDMLRHLVTQRFPLEREYRGSRSSSFLERQNISGRDSLDRLEKAVKRLADAITVDLDVRSNIVSFSVAARDRFLARALAVALFDSLNSFAVHQRQSSARNQRAFVERLLREARDSLSRDEEALRDFYQSNRALANSPRLQLVEKEIQRKIEVDQEIFLTLSRQYEEAQIAEVRDIPVLTLVDRPDAPARKSSPHRLVIAAMGMLLLAALAAVYVLRARLMRLVLDGTLRSS